MAPACLCSLSLSFAGAVLLTLSGSLGSPANAQTGKVGGILKSPSTRPARPVAGEGAVRQYQGGADSTQLEAFINAVMAEKNIPGLQAAIIKDGQLFWGGGFGLADPSQGVPVDISTLFVAASVSKTVTAMSLLQLVDQGLVGLDDPINNHLPFSINNPRFPTDQITVRQVLTHTASLRDNWSVMPASMGDSPYPLDQFIEDYFTPGGALYNPGLNFWDTQPGTWYAYCNDGFALAGYLVEAVTGQLFDSWSAANTLAALEMNAGNWRLANLDPADIASPCQWNGTTWNVLPHIGWREYPSTTLRTTANELAQFLIMVMQDGQYRGQTVLDTATAQALTTPQYPGVNPTQGLAFYSWTKSGRQLWGHNGADYGALTEMGFDKSTGIGFVVLTNGEFYFPNIVDALLNYAEAAPPATKMAVDVPSISLSTGGQQVMTLTGGTSRANGLYQVFGSLGGTVPGIDFGRGAILPLNLDNYFTLTLTNPALPVFGGFVGQLDASGNATATLTLPPGLNPALAGTVLEHAYLTAPPGGGPAEASNPTSVLIVP